jgi:hypothetical protein
MGGLKMKINGEIPLYIGIYDRARITIGLNIWE